MEDSPQISQNYTTVRQPIAVLLLLLATACATVQRGPMQRVHIETEPAGATVELIDCGVVDEERLTPVTAMIPRRVKRCSLLIHKDGYESARVFLERQRAEDPYDEVIFEEMCGDCNSLTDLLVAGAIGGVLYGISNGVDALAGSNYHLEPRHVQIALVPRDRPLDENP
jgi:hypothetical protein